MQREGNESKLVIEWPGDGPAVASSRPAATPAVQPQAPAAGAAPVPTLAESAQSRTDAARATALLTAQVRSRPAPLPPHRPPTRHRPPRRPRLLRPVSPQHAVVLAGRDPRRPAHRSGGDHAAGHRALHRHRRRWNRRPVMPSDASRIRMQAGMRHLVVAIDPGHGEGPGAIGRPASAKDVTLAVARELARQVNTTPGLKAYLTRDSDVFIPLPMRAQGARRLRRTSSSRSMPTRPKTARPRAHRSACCRPGASSQRAAGWRTRKTRPTWSVACACSRPKAPWPTCCWTWRRAAT